MNFTESLLVGIILAGVSGLTFVAYKHPRGYRIIAPSLLIIGLFWAMGRIAWDFGAIGANIEILRGRVETPNTLVDPLKDIAARLAHDFRDLEWTLGITTFVTAYLGFLLFLPFILGVLPTTKTKPDASEGTTEESAGQSSM